MEKGIKVDGTVFLFTLSIELNTPSESCDLPRNLYLHPRGGKRTFNLRNAYFCKQPTSIYNWLPQMCPILIWPWGKITNLSTIIITNGISPEFEHSNLVTESWPFRHLNWIISTVNCTHCFCLKNGFIFLVWFFGWIIIRISSL